MHLKEEQNRNQTRESLISCNIYRLESSEEREINLGKIELRSEQRLIENKIANTFIESIFKESTS